MRLSHLKPPPPPPQEALPRWRRVLEGVRHSMGRDAEAIRHHYDVSNRFYEHGARAVDDLHLRGLPDTPTRRSRRRRPTKYDLVARKLDLKPGQRLLDVGCGWGGMVRHAAREYGVQALGVTLSRAAGDVGPGGDRAARGSTTSPRCGTWTTATSTETGFDAVSSIGLTEHIGVRNYPAYFAFLRDQLRPEGRLLNHCITRPHNRRARTPARSSTATSSPTGS